MQLKRPELPFILFKWYLNSTISTLRSNGLSATIHLMNYLQNKCNKIAALHHCLTKLIDKYRLLSNFSKKELKTKKNLSSKNNHPNY